MEFNVIIPVYNNAGTIKRAIDSVQNQTVSCLLTVVDDCSTDGSREMLTKIDGLRPIFLKTKRFSGGARNEAMTLPTTSEYTLFLDADDEFIDPQFLQKLYDFIIENDYPDMVRLPYVKHYDGTGHEKVVGVKEFNERSISDVAHSPRVAAWTKAVKTSMLQPFPENTLMEDVCQHLLQCDVVETVAWFPDPVVRWHINGQSTSHNGSPKWRSSAWRFIADLMDLELTKGYTKARRNEKLRRGKENLRNGRVER